MAFGFGLGRRRVPSGTYTPPISPVLILSGPVTHAEGNSGTVDYVYTLTLYRDGSTASYPFSWAVTGTGANPANAADFGGTLPSGSGTFTSGQTSKTITVTSSGDTTLEADETFLLTVTAAGLNTPTALGTITNDDTPVAPAFSVQPSITGTPRVGDALSSLTYNDGTVTNGTVSTRTILLAGVSKVSTYVLLIGDLGASITYQVDASGAGGNVSATSASVTVQAAVVTYTVTAPDLTVVTDNATYPPQIDVTLSEDTLVGDTARLQYSHDGTFATGVTTVDHVLANTSPVSYSLSGIASGTNRFRASIIRGGTQVSDWSATATHGPDDLAPVISSPTAASTGTTTATIGATTDTGEGTIYFVIVLTNSQPSAAQIKAGQNSAGAAAAKTASITPVSAGAKTVNVTGLTSATTYYTFAMHEDVAGNQSNIVAASSILTDTAPAFSLTEVAAPAQVVSPGGTDYTFTGVSLGAANSTRVVYIAVEYDNSGGDLTGLEIDGSGATGVITHVGGLPGYVYALAVPTGTTADIKVKTGSAFNRVAIKVWSAIGAGSPVITKADASYYAHPFPDGGLSATVVTGGALMVFAGQLTATGTPTWSNATAQSFTQGAGGSFMSAKSSTVGTATISYTGFADYVYSYMNILAFPPA